METDVFKDQLVEAHRARRLELGRAELVDAIDPADDPESATRGVSAVYPFLRLAEESR
jgi:hypothetical protein